MNMKFKYFNLHSSYKYFQLIFFVFLCTCATAQSSRTNSTILLIRNVNVVDVLNGEILANQDVAVKNKLIYFIGNSFTEKVPTNSVTIDGNGKYLCPGLWDMHFHLCWDKNNDTLLFPVLLKNGITGIRDMGGDLNIMRSFKQKLSESKIIGPEIFAAGPMIDGNPPVHPDFSMPVDDKTNLTAALDSLKNNKVDFLKVYSLIKETQLRGVSNYCTNNNIHFAGHLSEYIEPEISISLGQKSIEHLNRLDDIWNTNKIRLDSIGNLMLANNTFLCPTLITYKLKTQLRDTSIINNDYSQYIPASLMEEWQITWGKRVTKHTEIADWQGLDETFKSQLQLVKHLNKMGVLILAGSDFAGFPYVYPGVSLHQELHLLVEAGLSNSEALKSATINPAIYMSHQKLYGSLTVGKYADMLILDKNPFDDIDNLKAINCIIIKGEILNNKK